MEGVLREMLQADDLALMGEAFEGCSNEFMECLEAF